MKKLCIAACFCLISKVVSAQFLPVTPSTATVSSLSVSSSVVTSLALSMSTGSAFPVFLTIQNQDALDPVFCSDSPSVAVSGANSGFEIAAAAVADFTLPRYEQFYCLAKTAAVQIVLVRSQ